MDAPRVGYAYVWWVELAVGAGYPPRCGLDKGMIVLGYTQYGHFFASDSKFRNPIGYGR